MTVVYGARTEDLLIYRDLVERCASRLPSLDVIYFVGAGPRGRGAASSTRDAFGRRRLAAAAETLRRRLFYISGPPAMLRAIGDDLRARDILPEAIHVDAWE